MSHALSRRRLLGVAGAGLSAGAAALVGGCGGEGKDARSRPESDIELFNAALELELVSVAAYERAAGRLRGELRTLARHFASHEREHADTLALVVEELGGRPRDRRATRDVALPRGERAILAFAVDIEQAAIASYIDALPRLGRTKLRPTLASILTTEAEHAAVLRDALGQEPVPLAFVDGRRG